MSDLTPFQRLLQATPAWVLRPRGNWQCPAHDDRRPSLEVTEQPDGDYLLHCHAGCSAEQVYAALGTSWAALHPQAPRDRPAETVYEYRDAAGELLAVKHRGDGKRFWWTAPDGTKGRPPGARTLYRLDEVTSASQVWVVEGEKDVEALRRLGEVATTAPDGATTWDPAWARLLHGKEAVTICGDNDDPGRAYVARWKQALLGHVGHLVVRWPLEPAKDISDHLGRGHELAHLVLDFDSDEHATPTGGEPLVARIAWQLASEVEPERVRWIWPQWLARGTLSLLVGRQGVGKSIFASWLAATLSAGRALPGGVRTDPQYIGWLSLEEPAGRISIRLEAAGAQLSGIAIFGQVTIPSEDGTTEIPDVFRLPTSIGALRNTLLDGSKGDGLDMLIIDGLGYSIEGDSHNYAAVGQALAPLIALAAERDIAVLGLMHPRKGASEAVTSAIGSTAWTVLPRTVWDLAREPDTDRRVLAMGKTNFKEPGGSWSFAIGDDEAREVGFAHDFRPSEWTAEELMNPQSSSERSGDAVIEWLADYVTEHGPCTPSEVVAAAPYAAITLKKYRDEAGIEVVRLPGARNHWQWRMRRP